MNSTLKFPPFIPQQLPRVSHGRGSWITDQDGKEYLDGSGGPAVFCIGHGDTRVNQAISAQFEQIAQGYRSMFSSDPLEALTALIQDHCGGGLTDMLFVSGGSEAVESCLKIALQYQQAIGQTGRTRFIARQKSYHGNTLGALSVSGYPMRRALFKDSLMPVSFVSAANDYRPPEGVLPGDIPEFAANELEAEILRLGEENVCAFIMEPVVGAAGCVVPAPSGYAQAIQAVCQKYGVLLIADEVMSGSGRMGTWRALEHDGVVPDIMSIAKGLGGGYLPLAAAVYQEKIGTTLREKHGGLMTGHTFMGHTAACASALKVQQVIAEENLLERVQKKGAWLGERLKSRIGDHTHVGNIRGRGYFWGIELVEDREAKRPFDPGLQMFARFGQALRDEGLLLYPTSRFVDEQSGDGVIVAPAYNASDNDLDEIVGRIEMALKKLFD
ncbi:MAG: adenosylmethionine-8-amino-7-oxononanoate aminotransferase [Cellvibrionaceae bacterium]|jgi:adenosylmethionine-8-amino-7-oxononanoate aminotransferase